MERLSKLDYFRKRGISVMNAIEDATGKMMSEIDRELENAFWAAESCKDEKRIMYAYNALAQLHDSLTMDN